VAVKVTLVPEQIVVEGEAAMFTLAAPAAVTDIVRVLDVAGEPVTQAAFEVITQVTASVLASVAEVKVALFVPAFTPFTFHWYEGVPPLAGVAVKVTLAPVQILVEGEAAMLTLAATLGFTVIVNVLDVAGEPVAQAAFEVITQVTASVLASVTEVKVALFVPAFTPFTFH
jgi:hypothetical protein